MDGRAAAGLATATARIAAVERAAPATLQRSWGRGVTEALAVHVIAAVGGQGGDRGADRLSGDLGLGAGNDLAVGEVEEHGRRDGLAAEGRAAIAEGGAAHEGDVEDDVEELGGWGAADADDGTAEGDRDLAGTRNVDHAVAQGEVLVSKTVLGILGPHERVARHAVHLLRVGRDGAELQVVCFAGELHDNVGVELFGVQRHPLH